jgi:hypothetical protein
VRERVEMSRQSSPAEVTDAIRSHRLDRLAAVVDDRQAQPRDRQRPLQQVEARPTARLRSRHGGSAGAERFRQLALAEIGAAPGPSENAGDVEGCGHATSLDRCPWRR